MKGVSQKAPLLIIKISTIVLFVLLSYVAHTATISWTGATNTSWHIASNWSTNTVPTKFDEVIISGNITYNIVITTLASCQRLEINTGVSKLLIYPNGALSINGQNTIHDDLLRIATGSTVHNYGTIDISNINSNLDQEAMDVSGIFINETTASLSIENVDFQAANWTEMSREAILVRENAMFENDGTVTIDDVEGNGMIVAGSLRNLANGIVILGPTIKYKGIRIEGGSSMVFDNYGEIRSTINYGLSSETIRIAQNVTATNYGLIRIDDATDAVQSITLESDLSNTLPGRIEIVESSGIQIGETGAGSVKLINEGNIILQRLGTLTGVGILIESGGELDNLSFVSATGYSVGVSVKSSGDIDTDGSITTASSANSGISNSGIIYNQGGILVDNCGYDSFRNYLTVINNITGHIEINRNGSVALRNSRQNTSYPPAIWDNYGLMTVTAAEGVTAITNGLDNTFRNRGQINVTSNSRMVNYGTFEFLGTIDVPTFQNSGDLVLLPSNSNYVFAGNLELGGEVEFSIASAFSYEKLKVDGDILLQGDIHAEFMNAYVPSTSTVFDLIECDGIRTGFVDALTSNLASLDHILDYDEQKLVQLKYSLCGNSSPENQFLSASGNWSNPNLWSLQHVPYPCERVLIPGKLGTPRVVTMDVSIEEIAKLTIYDNSELVIPENNKLVVNRNFRTSGGEEAIELSTGGHLTNEGTLEVLNVQEASFIWNAGTIINNGSILLENGSDQGVLGIFTYGHFENNTGAEIEVRNFFVVSGGDLKAVANSGVFFTDGLITSDYIFDNFNDGTLKGEGILRVQDVDNDANFIIGSGIASLEIDGNLELGPNSVLFMEVQGDGGGSGPNTHDHLHVTGHLIMRGEIRVETLASPTVVPTDAYEIINYGTSIGYFFTKNLNGIFTSWDVSNNGRDALFLLYHEDCINKTVEWVDNGSDDDWTTVANWQYLKLPLACHDVKINGRYTVDLPQLAKVNIGYLDIHDATLFMRIGSQLNVYGNESSNGIISLENAVISNKGTINIHHLDVHGKPSFRMNFRTDVLNYGTLNLLSDN